MSWRRWIDVVGEDGPMSLEEMVVCICFGVFGDCIMLALGLDSWRCDAVWTEDLEIE